MLSDQNRPVIEATLPVVGQHIGEIAQRFYRHMFATHPELLDGTFNRGNQARGEQQQALAGSVAAFASTLIQKPEHVPESLLSTDRAQARLAGHPPRPVPGRVRQPDVGDRRRARRRRHPAGRRRLGRGLLADGQRADQPGARPLQRPRRPAGDRVAALAGRERRSARPPTSTTFVVKRIDDRLVKTSSPASTSR